MEQRADKPSDASVVEVFNAGGRSDVVLVCEHASFYIPAEFNSLGLQAPALQSHIAWDPGAMVMAKRLSNLLDAKLVYSTVSRLVYDCNRPTSAVDAIPEISEATVIPGNQNLDEDARQDRVNRFYRPFEAKLASVLSDKTSPVLVTIHSFTPRYLGNERTVELGILHDSDTRLADNLLAVAGGFQIARNQPYGPEDGVTHTLRHHALPAGIPSVMIEVRNDLLSTKAQCEEMAGHLADWLTASISGRSTTANKEDAR